MKVGGRSKNSEYSLVEQRVMDELKEHFRPEFLNRLDEIIMFRPLSEENISKIADLIISDLNKRLADKRISIKLTDAAKKFVIDNGYDPSFGARPLKRFIQASVENLVAKAIIENKVEEGDEVTVDVKKGELFIA